MNWNAVFLIAAASAGALDSSAEAASLGRPAHIYVRNAKGGIEDLDTTLEGLLLSPDRFETEHFKVVVGIGTVIVKRPRSPDSTELVDVTVPIAPNLETALSTGAATQGEATPEAEDLRNRAASVLYHLERARTYFIETLGFHEVEDVSFPQQALIRLDMPYGFSAQAKVNFASNQNFNNVQTIPRDTFFAPGSLAPLNRWASEIWFRPSKRVPLTALERIQSAQVVKAQVGVIRNTFLGLEKDLAVRNVASGVFALTNGAPPSVLWSSLANQGRSTLFVEFLLQGFTLINHLFQGRELFRVPELIPEVVYHEYTHFAFQNYLSPDHSIPAPEAVANFFAAAMIESPEIAARFREAFRGQKTSGNSLKTYNPIYDSLSGNIRNDFNLSFLWQMQDPGVLNRRDPLEAKTFARKLILETVRHAGEYNLTTNNARLNPNFADAIVRTIPKVSDSSEWPSLEAKWSRYLIEKDLFEQKLYSPGG